MTHMAHHLVGALADGELRGLRRWLVNRHVQRCPVCAADFRAQRQVRQVLAASRVDVRMSDSPEFFWSKVKGEIQRSGESTTPLARPVPAIGDWLRQRQLTLAAAAMIVTLLSLWWALGTQPTGSSPNLPLVAKVEPAIVGTPDQAPPSELARPAPTAPPRSVSPSPVKFAEVESADSEIPNATVTTFNSKDTGVTVIWVSGLPWTEDLSEMQTVFDRSSS